MQPSVRRMHHNGVQWWHGDAATVCCACRIPVCCALAVARCSKGWVGLERVTRLMNSVKELLHIDAASPAALNRLGHLTSRAAERLIPVRQRRRVGLRHRLDLQRTSACFVGFPSCGARMQFPSAGGGIAGSHARGVRWRPLPLPSRTAAPASHEEPHGMLRAERTVRRGTHGVLTGYSRGTVVACCGRHDAPCAARHLVRSHATCRHVLRRTPRVCPPRPQRGCRERWS